MDERRDDWGWEDDAWPADGSEPTVDRSAVDTASLLIGAVAHAVQKAGPETTEHLVKAGHELMLAVRSFVRHFAEAMTEGQMPDRETIEHISISGSPAVPRPREVAVEAAEPKRKPPAKTSTTKKTGAKKTGAKKPSTKAKGTRTDTPGRS